MTLLEEQNEKMSEDFKGNFILADINPSDSVSLFIDNKFVIMKFEDKIEFHQEEWREKLIKIMEILKTN